VHNTTQHTATIYYYNYNSNKLLLNTRQTLINTQCICFIYRKHNQAKSNRRRRAQKQRKELKHVNFETIKNPDVYEELLKKPGNPATIEEIKKDKHRQFPFHEMFLDEQKVGQIELFNVLKAYSIYNPKVGFCQAQAPIAAFLLMHLPAEDAFWVFVSVCDV